MQPRTPTVLIADDLPDLRRLLSLTLMQLPASVITAENAEQAVTLARLHRPDVAVLDIMMPGDFDGLEACRRIKSDPVLNATKVILLTAKAQQSDFKAGELTGADAYVCKPFSPRELIALIETLVGRDTTESAA